MTEEIKISKITTKFTYTYQEASRLKKKLIRGGMKEKDIKISRNPLTNFDTEEKHKVWRIDYMEVTK